MKKIILLTDYKNRFGSKHFDNPYRSGMDKELLCKYFNEHSYEVEYKHLNVIDFINSDYKDSNILYTSSEDVGYKYKSYIEDIVLALELAGANVIPSYKFMRANNNKVFMELLRDINFGKTNLSAISFGSLKDLEMRKEKISFPCVFKESEGASGTGVFLIKNMNKLVSKIKKIEKNRNYKEDLKDYGRAIRHKGYIKESICRTKFIVQDFIPNLQNDWKIYIFGEKLYIFKRPILKGRGIKASGGGYDNYFYGQEAEAPKGVFDYSQNIFEKLNVPHVSIDIAYDGSKFYLLEFQALYFGTAGIPYSKGFFQKKTNEWEFVEKKIDIEKVYADSIVWFLNKKS